MDPEYVDYPCESDFRLKGLHTEELNPDDVEFEDWEQEFWEEESHEHGVD